jgi:hypothetical protein
MTVVEGIFCPGCKVFSPGKHEACPRCPAPTVRCAGYPANMPSPVIVTTVCGTEIGVAGCLCDKVNCVQRAKRVPDLTRPAPIAIAVGTHVDSHPAPKTPKKPVTSAPVARSTNSCLGFVCKFILIYFGATLAFGIIGLVATSRHKTPPSPLDNCTTIVCPAGPPGPESPPVKPKGDKGSTGEKRSDPKAPTLYAGCVILPKHDVLYTLFEVRQGRFRLVYQADNNLVIYDGPDDKNPKYASDTAGASDTGLRRNAKGEWFVGNRNIKTADKERNAICLNPDGSTGLRTIKLPLSMPEPKVSGHCVILERPNTAYGPFELTGKHGHYVTYQHDNNLVTYESTTRLTPTWASKTAQDYLKHPVEGIKRNADGSWWIGSHKLSLPYQPPPLPKHNALCVGDWGMLTYEEIDDTRPAIAIGCSGNWKDGKCTTDGPAHIAIGHKAPSKAGIAIGKSDYDPHASIAIGYQHRASASESIAIGYHAVAMGTNAVAIGIGASAKAPSPPPPTCIDLVVGKHITEFRLASPDGRRIAEFKAKAPIRITTDGNPVWDSKFSYNHIYFSADTLVYEVSPGDDMQVYARNAARICMYDRLVIINEKGKETRAAHP